jgi:nicotinamidase-related amidase
VENSRGWQFVPGILPDLITSVVRKGLKQRVDSYSAFYDNGDKNPSVMEELLKAEAITDVFVAGVAYDFCVGDTAVHAARAGFRTTVIHNATASVNTALPNGNSIDVMHAKFADKDLPLPVTVIETADELIGHNAFFPAIPVAKA